VTRLRPGDLPADNAALLLKLLGALVPRVHPIHPAKMAIQIQFDDAGHVHRFSSRLQSAGRVPPAGAGELEPGDLANPVHMRGGRGSAGAWNPSSSEQFADRQLRPWPIELHHDLADFLIVELKNSSFCNGLALVGK